MGRKNGMDVYCDSLTLILYFTAYLKFYFYNSKTWRRQQKKKTLPIHNLHQKIRNTKKARVLYALEAY